MHYFLSCVLQFINSTGSMKIKTSFIFFTHENPFAQCGETAMEVDEVEN